MDAWWLRLLLAVVVVVDEDTEVIQGNEMFSTNLLINWRNPVPLFRILIAASSSAVDPKDKDDVEVDTRFTEALLLMPLCADGR